eukprot:403366596
MQNNQQYNDDYVSINDISKPITESDHKNRQNPSQNSKRQQQQFNKSLTANYKITPSALKKHKMIKDRVNYHLNKSSDYNQKNNNPNPLIGGLNSDFGIIYSDESMLDYKDESQISPDRDQGRSQNLHRIAEINNNSNLHSSLNDSPELQQRIANNQNATNLLNLQAKVIGRNADIVIRTNNNTQQQFQQNELGNNLNTDEDFQKSVDSMPPLRQVVMTAYQNNRYDGQMNLQQLQNQRRQANSKLESSQGTVLMKNLENQSLINAGETTNAASYYESSHHFVMSKSVDKTSSFVNTKKQQQNLIKKYKQSEKEILHPYDSQQEEVTSVKPNQVIQKKQHLSQATLNKIMGKQARSTSRSFFTRRPKTVQQMIDLNSNSTFQNQKTKQLDPLNVKDRKYSTNLDYLENNLDQEKQIHNQTFDPHTFNQLNNPNGVLTNSLFKNNPQAATQFSTFKDALNNQLESQSLLQQSFQSAQGNEKAQQQILNQKLMKKQIELIRQRLDTREFEFQNKYGLNQESEKVFNYDKKEMHKEMIQIYEEALKDFFQKILKKQPMHQQIIDRCFQGIKQSYLKLQNHSEIEFHQQSLEIKKYQQEIEQLKKQNIIIQHQLDSEQEYLKNMFEKTKQEGLSQMVTEWEGMKSLADQLNESNFMSNKFLKRQSTTNVNGGQSNRAANFNSDIQELVNSEEGKQFLNDYSGVIIQLKDLYGMMRGNVFYDKQGDFNIDIKSELVVGKIENEMQEKFKTVQSATAMKVLKRFYKKIEYKDQATSIDEDPVEVERQRLERIIDHMRNDKDNDLKKIQQLQINIEQMQKSHNTVQVQYRETKSMLSQKTDECEQKEGEIKDLRGQFKYQNDQISKFQDQVKELMFKCDDYEQRLDMYKESMVFLENKHKKRKGKMVLLKSTQKTHNEQVNTLETQITELQTQIKQFEKQADPERKRIKLVKKPIFDTAGNQIGEGLVEQVITMRTDDSLGYLQSMQNSNIQRSEIGDDEEINEEDEFDEDDEDSNFSLDSEEMAQLEALLKEKGFDQPINDEHAEEHKKRMSQWFQRMNKGSMIEDSDEQEKVKQALALQFKNQIRMSRRVKIQEQKEQRKSNKAQNKKRNKESVSRRDQDEDQEDEEENKSQHLRVSSKQDQQRKTSPKPQSRASKKPSLKIDKTKMDPSQSNSPAKQTKSSVKVDTKASLNKNQVSSKQVSKQSISQKTPQIKNKSKNLKDEEDSTQQIETFDDAPNEQVRSKMQLNQPSVSNLQDPQQNDTTEPLHDYLQQSNTQNSMQKQVSRNTILHKKKESTFEDSQQNVNGSMNGGSSIMQYNESPREPRVQIMHRSKDDISNDYEMQTSNNERLNQANGDSQIQQISGMHDKSDSTLMNKSKKSLGQQSNKLAFNITKTYQRFYREKASKSIEERSYFVIYWSKRSRSQSLYQSRLPPQHTSAYLAYNSKHIQTDLAGDVVRKPNAQGLSGETIQTQTEDFMFPMDEELKQKVMNLIGGRLSKYGDTYDKGSSFFTKANQIIDEIEDRFFIDIDQSTMSKKEYYQLRAANGLQDPRYKQFKPVLKTVKNTNNKQ